MEKYYLSNGKEVKVGDVITKSVDYDSPVFGKVHLTKRVKVIEDLIPSMLKKGWIFLKEKDTNESYNIPMTLDYYIQKIARRLNWKSEKAYNYLSSIDSIYPVAAFSIVLREIAIELDKKYEDHISNSKNIYTISTLDAKIFKVNKAYIKSYKNFAAFRTLKDAETACNITRDILKDLFKK